MESASVEDYLLQLKGQLNRRIQNRAKHAAKENIGRRTGKVITNVKGLQDISQLFQSDSDSSLEDEIESTPPAQNLQKSAKRQPKVATPPEFQIDESEEDDFEDILPPDEEKKGKYEKDSDYASFTPKNTSEESTQQQERANVAMVSQATQYSSPRTHPAGQSNRGVPSTNKNVTVRDTGTSPDVDSASGNDKSAKKQSMRKRTPHSLASKRVNTPLESAVSKPLYRGTSDTSPETAKKQEMKRIFTSIVSSREKTVQEDSDDGIELIDPRPPSTPQIASKLNTLASGGKVVSATPNALRDYIEMLSSQKSPRINVEGTRTGSITKKAPSTHVPTPQQSQGVIRRRLTFSEANRASLTPSAANKVKAQVAKPVEVSPAHPIFELDATSEGEFVIEAAETSKHRGRLKTYSSPAAESNSIKRRKSVKKRNISSAKESDGTSQERKETSRSSKKKKSPPVRESILEDDVSEAEVRMEHLLQSTSASRKKKSRRGLDFSGVSAVKEKTPKSAKKSQDKNNVLKDTRNVRDRSTVKSNLSVRNSTQVPQKQLSLVDYPSSSGSDFEYSPVKETARRKSKIFRKTRATPRASVRGKRVMPPEKKMRRLPDRNCSRLHDSYVESEIVNKVVDKIDEFERSFYSKIRKSPEIQSEKTARSLRDSFDITAEEDRVPSIKISGKKLKVKGKNDRKRLSSKERTKTASNTESEMSNEENRANNAELSDANHSRFSKRGSSGPTQNRGRSGKRGDYSFTQDDEYALPKPPSKSPQKGRVGGRSHAANQSSRISEYSEEEVDYTPGKTVQNRKNQQIGESIVSKSKVNRSKRISDYTESETDADTKQSTVKKPRQNKKTRYSSQRKNVTSAESASEVETRRQSSHSNLVPAEGHEDLRTSEKEVSSATKKTVGKKARKAKKHHDSRNLSSLERFKASGLESWLKTGEQFEPATTPEKDVIQELPWQSNILHSTAISRRARFIRPGPPEDTSCTDMTDVPLSQDEDHPPLPTVNESTITGHHDMSRIKFAMPRGFGPPASTPRQMKRRTGRIQEREETPKKESLGQAEEVNLESSSSSVTSESHGSMQSYTVTGTRAKNKLRKKKASEKSAARKTRQSHTRERRGNAETESEQIHSESGVEIPNEMATLDGGFDNDEIAGPTGSSFPQGGATSSQEVSEPFVSDSVFEREKGNVSSRKQMETLQVPTDTVPTTSRSESESKSKGSSKKRGRPRKRKVETSASTSAQESRRKPKKSATTPKKSAGKKGRKTTLDSEESTLVASDREEDNTLTRASGVSPNKKRRVMKTKKSSAFDLPDYADPFYGTEQHGRTLLVYVDPLKRLPPPEIIIPVPSPEAIERGLRRSTRVRTSRRLQTHWGERMVYEAAKEGAKKKLVGLQTSYAAVKPIEELMRTEVVSPEKRKPARRDNKKKQPKPKKPVPKKMGNKTNARLGIASAVSSVGVPESNVAVAGSEANLQQDDFGPAWYDESSTGVDSEANILPNQTSGANFSQSSAGTKNATMQMIEDNFIAIVDRSSIYCKPETEVYKDPMMNGSMKLSKGLASEDLVQGMLIINPREFKKETTVKQQHVMSFFVYSGTIVAKINDAEEKLGPKSYFKVPQMNKYALYNPDHNVPAVLHYNLIRKSARDRNVSKSR